MTASGLQAAGWDWISFDDVSIRTLLLLAAALTQSALLQCWEADERDANGNLQADPSRFPDGMPAMVDFIHAANFSVQIYTSLGRSTCSRSGRPLPLPGSYGHESQVSYPAALQRATMSATSVLPCLQDAAWFAKIGADGMKGDWCNASGLLRQNVTDTMAAAINATGHPLWWADFGWRMCSVTLAVFVHDWTTHLQVQLSLRRRVRRVVPSGRRVLSCRPRSPG